MSGKSNGRATREGDQLLQGHSDSDSEVQEFAMSVLQPKRTPARRRMRTRQRSSGGCKGCIRGCFVIFFVALIGAVGFMGYTVWKMRDKVDKLNKKVSQLEDEAQLTTSLKASQKMASTKFDKLQQQVNRHHKTLSTHNHSLSSLDVLRQKLNDLSGAVPSLNFEVNIKALEEKVAGLQRGLDNADQGMARFHSDLEGVQSKQEEMQKAVGVYSPSSPSLSARFDTMEKNHSKTTKEVESLQARVAGLKSLLDSNSIQLTAIEHRVKPLEESSEKRLVVTGRHHQNITALQMELRQLEEKVDHLSIVDVTHEDPTVTVSGSSEELSRVNETLRQMIVKLAKGVLHIRKSMQAKLDNVSRVVDTAMSNVNQLNDILVALNYTVMSSMLTPIQPAHSSISTPAVESSPATVSSPAKEAFTGNTDLAANSIGHQLQDLWANVTKSQGQLQEMDRSMTSTMGAMEAELRLLNASMVQHQLSTSKRFDILKHHITTTNKSLPLPLAQIDLQSAMKQLNVSQLLNQALKVMASPEAIGKIFQNLEEALRQVNLTALLAGVDWAGSLETMVNASFPPEVYWQRVMQITDKKTIDHVRQLQMQSIRWLHHYMQLMLAVSGKDRRRLGKQLSALSASVLNHTVEVLNALERSKEMNGASSIQLLSDDTDEAAVAAWNKIRNGQHETDETAAEPNGGSQEGDEQNLGNQEEATSDDSTLEGQEERKELSSMQNSEDTHDESEGDTHPNGGSQVEGTTLPTEEAPTEEDGNSEEKERLDLAKATQALYKDFSRWDKSGNGKLSLREVTYAFHVKKLLKSPGAQLFLQVLRDTHHEVTRNKLKKLLSESQEQQANGSEEEGNKDDTEEERQENDGETENEMDTGNAANTDEGGEDNAANMNLQTSEDNVNSEDYEENENNIP